MSVTDQESTEVRQIEAGENPTRFARGWHCLGLIRDFNDGSPHQIDAFGTSLVVFADSQGRLNVLDAYCRHMGGNLAHGSVKGDSIATIVIALINIVAGLAVGVFSNNLPIAEAAHKYTILTDDKGVLPAGNVIFLTKQETIDKAGAADKAAAKRYFLLAICGQARRAVSKCACELKHFGN